MNDFVSDLEFSLKDDSSINPVYFRMFRDLKEIVVVDDIETQKRGIDKILITNSGRKILIDEKKRRVDYGDILLEEYSDFDKKKVGWLGREKYTDYIAYIIWTNKKLYLLPFVILQKAWINNYHNWLDQYGRLFADNKYYRTSNIAIPTEVLFNCMRREMEVCFTD